MFLLETTDLLCACLCWVYIYITIYIYYTYNIYIIIHIEPANGRFSLTEIQGNPAGNGNPFIKFLPSLGLCEFLAFCLTQRLHVWGFQMLNLSRSLGNEKLKGVHQKKQTFLGKGSSFERLTTFTKIIITKLCPVVSVYIGIYRHNPVISQDIPY